jgi:hypothetical protein
MKVPFLQNVQIELGHQIVAYRFTNNALEIVQMELGYQLVP